MLADVSLGDLAARVKKWEYVKGLLDALEKAGAASFATGCARAAATQTSIRQPEELAAQEGPRLAARSGLLVHQERERVESMESVEQREQPRSPPPPPQQHEPAKVDTFIYKWRKKSVFSPVALHPPGRAAVSADRSAELSQVSCSPRPCSPKVCSVVLSNSLEKLVTAGSMKSQSVQALRSRIMSRASFIFLGSDWLP
jgi:hypothetical protein